LTAAGAPVGQRDRVDALRAVLGEHAGQSLHEPRVVSASPGGEQRVRSHRIHDPPLGRVPGCEDVRAERPRQREEAERENRRTAAVHAGGAGPLARAALQRPSDRHLQRVRGIEIRRRGPVVDDAGGKHRRMLSRAVHDDPLRLPAGSQVRVELPLAERQRGRRAQRRLVQASAGEDPSHAVEVEVLARVAARGEREQLAVEIEAGMEHRCRLHRLARRAGEHGSGDVAGRERERAVAVEGHERAAVAALHEAGAHHLDEHRGLGHQRRARLTRR
jgi:hypothetical protein